MQSYPRTKLVALIANGFVITLVASSASAQESRPAHAATRVDGLRWITGSDAALREAATDVAATGCIVFESKVRQDAGGLDACQVISGGGTNTATVASGGCAVVIDSYISNFGCNGAGPAGALKAWQMHFGSDAELPSGISGADTPACVETPDCHDLGYYGFCEDTNLDFVPDTCPRAWVQPEIVPNALLDVPYPTSDPYSGGANEVSSGPLVDDGSEFYGMSMRMLVDDIAPGTVTIPFLGAGVVPGNWVIMADGSTPPVGKLIGATIEVPEGEYCCGSGACSFGGSPGSCAAMGMSVASWSCLGDCNNNSFDDACENMKDCNGNGVGDRCDISSNFSDDCNLNQVPDECEAQDDCDNNGVQDICDAVDREANDCNWNNVPDSCDIAAGDEPDDDGNGVIDYCERRSRFVFFDAPAGEVAIRVKFLNLDLFEGFNEEVRWVGAAAERQPTELGASFWASEAGCDPVLTTWPVGERLYVFGSSIVPNSDYEIRFADAACLASGLESCMSDPIELSTWIWGDLRSPYLGHESIAQPNAFDLTALVDSFKENGFALHYTRVRLFGNVLNVDEPISFADISACVDAVKGFIYSYAGPDPCP